MNAETETRSNSAWTSGVRERDSAVLSDLRAYLCRSLTAALSGRTGQSDVEDFAQLALERILDVIDTYRDEARFTTWASAIAIRIAFSALRRKQWGSISLDALLAEGSAPEMGSDSDEGEKAAKVELLGALQMGIQEVLSERQRTVVLAELRGMPTAVLSAELGVTPGALYKTHHDARKKLRGYLEKKGFRPEDLTAVAGEGGKSI